VKERDELIAARMANMPQEPETAEAPEEAVQEVIEEAREVPLPAEPSPVSEPAPVEPVLVAEGKPEDIRTLELSEKVLEMAVVEVREVITEPEAPTSEPAPEPGSPKAEVQEVIPEPEASAVVETVPEPGLPQAEANAPEVLVAPEIIEPSLPAAEPEPVEVHEAISGPEATMEGVVSEQGMAQEDVPEMISEPEVLIVEPVFEKLATQSEVQGTGSPSIQVDIAPEPVEMAAPAVEETFPPVRSEMSVPAETQPSSLMFVDKDVELSVMQQVRSDIKLVDDNTAVVQKEPLSVPAIRDDQNQLVIPKERGIPALADRKTSIAVQPQDVLPSLAVSEGGALVVPSADTSIVASPANIQPPLIGEEQSIVPKAVMEVPAEPEIPISDRELKAAVILSILGENERALEEIDLYIREKSESHDARHVKAIILDDLGRLPESLEELKEAIRLDPRDEIALLDIESLSRRLGRKEESNVILSSIAPSKEVRAREAANMLEAKRYDDILSKFYGPGQADSLVSRMAVATSLMAKGRYRDAYRVLKELLLEHPTYPEALNNMGVCMRFMGEYGYDEPMHFMRLAVEGDPNYGDAWNNIGATLFVLGEYEAAMEAIRKAITVGRRSDYLINLSKCQIMVGDIDGAKLSLTSALKYEETAEIDFALALIAEKEGEMKWALKLYDSAIELFPNFKDAIFNRQRVKLFLKYTQK